ncbi:MAG: hypothetical protein QOJ04_6802, partial [Caballeronia sp.]|nr:hypothetical protein [Caballeronia sp.]
GIHRLSSRRTSSADFPVRARIAAKLLASRYIRLASPTEKYPQRHPRSQLLSQRRSGNEGISADSFTYEHCSFCRIERLPTVSYLGGLKNEVQLRSLAPARSEEDFLSAMIVYVDYNAHVFKHGDAHG